MTVVLALVSVYVAASLLYWLWTAYATVRVVREVPRLERLKPPEPERWPRLSVVVPAANEADKVASAGRTLLEEDYPDLQIVFVDDRSTDETGRVLDELAADDGRVQVVHVTELPAGWLGKTNALRAGLERTDGQFILFTDADVHLAPGTLRKAVAHCLAQRLDHLTAMPELWPTTFWLDAALALFCRQFLTVMTRPWAVSDPVSSAFMGVGAFNLFRRSALADAGGLEGLRLEVGDDMALGLLMKQSGARCGVVAGFGAVALHWHRSFAEAARGAEKGYGPACNFSVVRAAGMAAAVLALELAPLLAPLPLAVAPLRAAGWAGLGVLAAFVFSVAVLHRWVGKYVLAGLATPLAAPVMTGLFVRAAILGRRRGGVLWRGTLYPTETLREHMRLRISLARQFKQRKKSPRP